MPTEINSTNIVEVIPINNKIRFERKASKPDVQDFRICAVEFLENNEWQHFTNNLLDDYDFIDKHSQRLCVGSDEVVNALLVLNKDGEDGILVNSEGSAYARYSAYLPLAGHLLDYYVNMILNHCVAAGTMCTSDGVWAVSFDEIHDYCDVEIVEGSGLDEMVLRKLQLRDEVAEAIQTEDGFEITFHLEHCPQCNAGGIEAGFSLLSLLGCTLQDVHFIEKDGSDIVASITELNANMITEQGREEWADVLSTKVGKIFNHQGQIMIELEDFDKLRLQSFAYASHGLAENSSAWFKDPDEPQPDFTNNDYEYIIQDDFEIAYAKHILWLNDLPGGKQLDMSGCRLEDINLANRKLLNANFSDALLVGCNMNSAELCFANFSGAFLDHCSMQYVNADEINFRGATLKESDLSYILLYGGNFAHATFYKSELFNCNIGNTCFEGTRFVDTPTANQNIDLDFKITDADWVASNEGQVMQ